MGVKFVGYQRIAGEKSKKTGQPYDFVNLHCIDDSNSNVAGYEPITISVTTEELTEKVGKDLYHLADILNSEVVFNLGFVNGRPRIDGFTVKK